MLCDRAGDLNEISAGNNEGMMWEDIEKGSEKREPIMFEW
jgi:hypothetical protein